MEQCDMKIVTSERELEILGMELEVKRGLEMEPMESPEEGWRQEIIVSIDTLGRVCTT